MASKPGHKSSVARRSPRLGRGFTLRLSHCVLFMASITTLSRQTTAAETTPPPPDRAAAIERNDKGEDLRKQGEIDNAIHEYSAAIGFDPSFAWPYNNRGLAYATRGDFENALKDYAEAIRLDPEYAYPRNNRGLVWTARREFDRTIEDYSEAIRIDPRYAFPYNNRGIVWELKGEYQKAIADFAEASQLDPKYVSPLNAIAWLRATCPDARYRAGNEAVELATRACQLTEWKSYAELDTLAAAYAEAGEFTNAVIWQLTALDHAPTGEKVHAQARLELYRSEKPFRQTPLTEAKSK